MLLTSRKEFMNLLDTALPDSCTLSEIGHPILSYTLRIVSLNLNISIIHLSLTNHLSLKNHLLNMLYH